MWLKKQGAILLNGFVVVAPIIVTVYVVWKTLSWLDAQVRDLLLHINWVENHTFVSRVIGSAGIGIVVGLAAIYAVGLLAKLWVVGGLIRLGENLIERIPLVKSLYSAVRDLLQFLGGSQAESHGKSAVLRTEDGSLEFLGIITQEQPEKFLPGDEDRIGVYLPMSYQLGGFTVFVPKDRVEELPDVSVEELMKLALTAGVGGNALRQVVTGEAAPEPITEAKEST